MKMDKESDHHRKTLNKASGEIQQLKTRQETLQEKVNKESDYHTKTLKTTNGEIQQLETRMVNVERRQGTLQDEIDKNSDHTKALKTTNDEIQRLETKMVNVERRQGKDVLKTFISITNATGKTFIYRY
ncbi:uncharacterized protein LOC128558733 [Mercenaria mercenaria]|uniref:uncharacterized protein LOC128558733 n=1 Tax=Mercenaria mercenaria TaxID=6596 RepID=UPI00234F469C|nr:uncharacterized protein LOC128558733 [Mercenaria mercenaria]